MKKSTSAKGLFPFSNAGIRADAIRRKTNFFRRGQLCNAATDADSRETIILDARANRTQNVGLSEQFGVYISIDDIGAGCGGAIRDIQLGSAVVYSRVGGPTAQCKAEYKVPSGSKGESFALRYCAAGRQKGVYYAYEWVEGSPPADASTEPEPIQEPETKVSKTKRILATATREPLEISSNFGTTWSTITVGQAVEISVQDMIRTGKQSRAEIVFPDGTVFHLKSNTIMTLVAGGVKVQVGEAWFNLRKQRKRFRVVTPTTVCGPLGTAGIVTYTQDGISIIKLVEGEMEVSNQAGEGKIILKAGQLTVVPPCGVPTSPCNFDVSKLAEPMPELRPDTRGNGGAAGGRGGASTQSASTVSTNQALQWYEQGLDAIRSHRYANAVDLLSRALGTGRLDKKRPPAPIISGPGPTPSWAIPLIYCPT